MTLGEKIKKLRSKKGLTQKELADEVHVTFQTVSKWEKDENEPDVSTLRELSKIFSCSMDYLLSQSDDEEVEEKVEEIPTAVAANKNKAVQETQESNTHVCEYCHKEIPHDELKTITTYSRVGGSHRRGHHVGGRTVSHTHYYHAKCLETVNENRRKEHEAEIRKIARKCWIWSIAAGVLALAISLWIMLSMKDQVSTGGAIGLSILFMYAIFAMVFCILSGSYLGDVFVWCAGASIKFPGIIFSFDLGGFAFLIIMKVLFAVIGFLVGVLAFIAAVALCGALGAVSFPFVLIHDIRNDYDDSFFAI